MNLIDVEYKVERNLDTLIADNRLEFLSQIEHLAVVALCKESIIGYAIAINEYNKCILTYLYVSDKYRNRGLGADLIKYVDNLLLSIFNRYDIRYVDTNCDITIFKQFLKKNGITGHCLKQFVYKLRLDDLEECFCHKGFNNLNTYDYELRSISELTEDEVQQCFSLFASDDIQRYKDLSFILFYNEIMCGCILTRLKNDTINIHLTHILERHRKSGAAFIVWELFYLKMIEKQYIQHIQYISFEVDADDTKLLLLYSYVFRGNILKHSTHYTLERENQL